MIITCPHCKTLVDAQVVAHAANSYILKCLSCENRCFAEDRGWIDAKTKKQVYNVVYPVAPPKDDPTIPPEVQRDYIEAVMCHNIGACRATAAMCRRTLQTSAVQKGASKKRLIDQIDELLAKNIISPQLADWAHEIRLWGNIGAHPDEDGLEDISADDAQEIMDFTTEYLEHVYSMPARIQAQKTKREAMKPKEP